MLEIYDDTRTFREIDRFDPYDTRQVAREMGVRLRTSKDGEE